MNTNKININRIYNMKRVNLVKKFRSSQLSSNTMNMKWQKTYHLIGDRVMMMKMTCKVIVINMIIRKMISKRKKKILFKKK
jgi:hypothetical protein